MNKMKNNNSVKHAVPSGDDQPDSNLINQINETVVAAPEPEVDIIKYSDPVQSDVNMYIDTRKLQERYRFFEDLKGQSNVRQEKRHVTNLIDTRKMQERYRFFEHFHEHQDRIEQDRRRNSLISLPQQGLVQLAPLIQSFSNGTFSSYHQAANGDHNDEDADGDQVMSETLPTTILAPNKSSSNNTIPHKGKGSMIVPSFGESPVTKSFQFFSNMGLTPTSSPSFPPTVHAPIQVPPLSLPLPVLLSSCPPSSPSSTTSSPSSTTSSLCPACVKAQETVVPPVEHPVLPLAPPPTPPTPPSSEGKPLNGVTNNKNKKDTSKGEGTKEKKNLKKKKGAVTVTTDQVVVHSSSSSPSLSLSSASQSQTSSSSSPSPSLSKSVSTVVVSAAVVGSAPVSRTNITPVTTSNCKNNNINNSNSSNNKVPSQTANTTTSSGCLVSATPALVTSDRSVTPILLRSPGIRSCSGCHCPLPLNSLSSSPFLAMDQQQVNGGVNGSPSPVPFHSAPPPMELGAGCILESTPQPTAPHVVRSSDVVDDIPRTETTKKMLGVFKQLELNGANNGLNGSDNHHHVAGGKRSEPKPLKRITPPRELDSVSVSSVSASPAHSLKHPNTIVDTDSSSSSLTTTNNTNTVSGATNSLPNSVTNSALNPVDVVKGSIKEDDVIPVEPEMARSLKAKFENWANDVKPPPKSTVIGSVELMGSNGQVETPQLDITKNLKAKFESFTHEPEVKPQRKMRINRFVQENDSRCNICDKTLYPMEKVEFSGVKMHKTCFKCTHCNSSLRLDNYTMTAGKFYCLAHFKQLFMAKGNYDEGFGQEQHKDKWNSRSSSRNQTPDESSDPEVEPAVAMDTTPSNPISSS